VTDINAVIARQVDRYFTGRHIEQATTNQTTADDTTTGR
jgi:hypothetical protein